jgi:hypothetical protein
MNGPETKANSQSDENKDAVKNERSLWICHDLPMIKADTVMKDTAYWEYLNRQKEGHDVFTESIKAYLLPFGFDIREHVLPKFTLRMHKTVHNHWWWCKVHKLKMD